MFRSTTIIRELTLSLAKVTFIKSVKIRSYGLCGCVAAFCIKSMVVCVLAHTQILVLSKTDIKSASVGKYE
jgi:hypothetical protein